MALVLSIIPWNWQLPDWPDFCFDADRIRASEERFLKGSGVVVGALHHLDADARDGLTIELISQEIVDSSAIEGEILDRDSVQSSLARHLGFAADQRRASAAEAGAAELMADVYLGHTAPLDDRTLFAWHAMLMNGRRAIAEKTLAQNLAAPTLTALAETIHRHRKAYYAALQLGSQSNDIDAWLTWLADIVIEAQARTITRIRFLIDKTRLLDRLRGEINERQKKALLRLFREGPDGFAGGLSTGNYRTITGASTFRQNWRRLSRKAGRGKSWLNLTMSI